MERKDIIKLLVDIVSKIKKKSFNLDEISEETYLGGDMGIDSIEMLEALHDLQKGINIKIKQEDMNDIYTIKDVVDLVVKYL